MKEQEAYEAMVRFLDDRYRRVPSEALGTLLGELQLAADGKPFDPAIEEEWDRAVGVARQARGPRSIEPQRRAS